MSPSSGASQSNLRVFVLHAPETRERAETTLSSAVAAGLEATAIDTTANGVLDEASAWSIPDADRRRTPGEQMLFALSIGDDQLRYLVAVDLLSRTPSRAVTIVVDAGVVFRSAPTALVAVAEAHGFCVPRRRLSAVGDDMEPWIGTLDVDGILDWSFAIATGDGADVFADVRDGIIMGWEHRDFGAAHRYRDQFAGLVPEVVDSGPAYCEPSYLPDGGDLPPQCEVVNVRHFDPNRPFLPDGRLVRPRVTTLGRPALAEFLGEDLMAGNWGAVPRRVAKRSEPSAIEEIAQQVSNAPDAVRTASISTISEFEAWLSEPIDDSGQSLVSRALMLAWERRPDLQAVFPDPRGSDAASFAAWGWERGVQEDEVPGHLLRPAPDEAVELGGGRLHEWLAGRRRGPLRTDADPSPNAIVSTAAGVLILGHFTTLNGLGNVARALVEDLQQAGVATSTRIWETGSRSTVPWQQTPGVPRHIALSVLGAEANVSYRLPRDFMAAERRIALVYWEVDAEIPGADEYQRIYDEIWAPSRFVKGIIERSTDVPVYVMPQRGSFTMALGDEKGLSATTEEGAPYILFSFDFFSVAQRKNPVGLVRAFQRAFGNDDGVRLVIKALNADGARADLAELMHEIGSDTRVEVITNDLSHDGYADLMRNAAAYASLHRSEGFGLTLAEAMVNRVPVVATDYGGSRDFATADTALLVPFDLVPVGERGFPYPESAVWADPDIDSAAEQLRLAVAGGRRIEQMTDRALENLRHLYGDAAFRTFLAERDIVSERSE